MILAILGPTASHKSELAEFLANKYNAEVINFDAYQIYIEMNKGTAKPTEEFLKDHPNYHLYNFKHIDENYDVAQFQKDGRALLEKCKDKNIILVGGTGFYLKALLYDYRFEEEERMDESFLANLSNEELYERLLKLDEVDAKKIGVNNRKRLLRALYIYNVHKKTKTEINENGKNELLYEVRFIGLNPPRDILYERINRRVDLMIDSGLILEAKEIKEKFDNKANQALQAIGYKEFYLGLEKSDAIELIKKNTRNYAKRQLTFFRHQFENVNWYESVEEALENE